MNDDATPPGGRDATTARETVDAYYEALRAGDPLGPFFADAPGVLKVGISERLDGHDEIVAGLRDQTGTTTDWTVDSRDRHVTERGSHAWYHDDVLLGWTDTEARVRYEFETRWSGTLERRSDGWRFVVLHVSTPGDL